MPFPGDVLDLREVHLEIIGEQLRHLVTRVVTATIELRPVHQVPVLLWTAGGLDMTHNPAWVEPADLPGGPGLRAWFMPEDDRSTIYVYEVATK